MEVPDTDGRQEGVKLASWQEEILVENNNISNNIFAGGWEDGAGIDIKGSSWGVMVILHESDQQ